MAKATVDQLTDLHGALAAHMLQQLESGNVEAKDLAVIVKFLKDNKIDLTLELHPEKTSEAFDALVKHAQDRIAGMGLQ